MPVVPDWRKRFDPRASTDCRLDGDVCAYPRADMRGTQRGWQADLGLGRAHVLRGETVKAKAAYKDFLTLWKDADPHIPVPQQAKAGRRSFCNEGYFASCIGGLSLVAAEKSRCR
jgi:hypothetical protein